MAYDMIAMLAMAKVKKADVVVVYSGQANACACGCKGTYRYAKAHQAQGGKGRGYEVTADEVNDGQVTRVLRVMNANPTAVEQVAPGHFAADVAGRMYMVLTVEAR